MYVLLGHGGVLLGGVPGLCVCVAVGGYLACVCMFVCWGAGLPVYVLGMCWGEVPDGTLPAYEACLCM